MGDKSYHLESNKSESPWDDECTMLGVDNQSFCINNNVFPPVEHEGLHIHSQIFPQSLHQFKPTTSPSKSKIPNSQLNVTRCWNLWFKFMHRTINYARSRLLNCSVSRMFLFLFSPATVLLLVLWYSRVLRRRRALRKESRDQLIRILAERDEEIGKLMRQITQMNKLLCGAATSTPRASCKK